MDKMNSVSIAITWCLAWGNQRQPQFDITVLQEMYEALRNGREVPEAVREIVDQVREFQSIPDDYFPPTLDDLKQKYSNLWNQTTKIGLVYGGVTKVKQYVFELSKIQEIRGASGLLDRINIIDLPAFFNKKYQPESNNDKNSYSVQCNEVKQWLNENFNQDYKLSEVLISELIVYSTGGNILAFCPAAYVHNLADAIEKRYTTETLTANSCAVGDTFKLLEIRFGLLKEKIEDTLWLDWYRQNYKKPIVQAYFGYPQNGQEQLEVFKTRKSFNEITTKLAVLFNKRRSGNDIPGRKTTRRYPVIFETHPYLVRDEVENRSAILQVEEGGLSRETYFSEASVRKYLVGNRAKKGQSEQPDWYQEINLEWRVNRIEKWTDRFDNFLEENPSLKTKYYRDTNPQTVETSATLTQVSNASNRFIAYIYADGNNMGGYIQKQIKTPQQYQEFSKDVELATQYAVYQALAENLHPHILKGLNDEESVLKNDDLIHPFEIITIGGDDILIVVPANKALEISQMIAERFEEILLKKIELAEIQIQGKEKRILGNYQLKFDQPFEPHKIHRYQPATAKRSECELSTSIGVLITAVNTPIYYAQDLTEQLLKSAKERAKKLKKFGYYGGTVDFLTLKSVTMIASNVKDFRTEALTIETSPKLKLYAAPYTLHELGGLIKSISALKKAKFPKSQLYQIRSLLERGKHTAILNYRYFRVRLKQGQKELKANFEDVWCLPKDDTNKGNLAPWMYDKEEKNYETIWRDMVDIYEFVQSAEDEESAILTAEVES